MVRSTPKQSGLTAISLFSGVGGLDLGLEQAGFDVRAHVDIDPFAAAALRANWPASAIIEADVRAVTGRGLLRTARLRRGDLTLLSAGFPCQPWSTIGRRGSLRDDRGSLFHEVTRLIDETRPRFFLLENVRGILSAAIKHRPIADRTDLDRKLRPEERPGSALALLLAELSNLGYNVQYQLVNAADVGVPQKRERVLFVGARSGESFSFPKLTHSGKAIGRRRWRSLRDAIVDAPSSRGEEYGPGVRRVFDRVPPGGCWRDLPPRLAKRVMGKAWYASGGRYGFYRRLSYDRPCPTVTSRPAGKATGFCHPEVTRPLTLAEWKRVQQFDDNFDLFGPLWRQYTHVGNAVPVGLGAWIGRGIASEA